MGAGNREHVATRQHVFGQPLRARGVLAACIQHCFDRGVAARERVADHDLVAVGRNVFRQVARRERDAQGFQLGGHRRIDRLVAALDRMPEFPRQRGHAAHESAGDAEDMEFAHAAIVADLPRLLLFRLCASGPLRYGRQGRQTRRAARTMRAVSGRHRDAPSENPGPACGPGARSAEGVPPGCALLLVTFLLHKQRN